MVAEFPLLFTIHEVYACFIDDKHLLGEGVGGTRKDDSDGFRLGDVGGNPDSAMTKGSSGISLSWVCNLAICFRKSSCLRRSCSSLLLEDSMVDEARVPKLNKRDALFGCADCSFFSHKL
jgi:hypothetical protein